MIILTLPDNAKKISSIFDGSVRWCYVGKDITKRQRIARAMGENKRFYLKDRLYRIAQRTRQSYLDFIAKVGREQKDQLNWWASKFASKSPFHTDFFLLVCYEALIMELIKERDAINTEVLVIFVEDPWLFVEIKNLGFNGKNIKFRGYPNLLINKFFCLVRGLAYRLFLVGWFVLAKLLIRFYHNGKKPSQLVAKKNATCIVNPADKTVFQDGNYVTNYMPGLSSFYEENGICCFYLYSFPFPLSTARDVGRNQKILWPLIIDAKFFSIVKRIFEHWNPNLDGEAQSTVDDYHVSYLLDREKWITFSKVGFNFHLIQFDAWNNFFNKRWCSHIIYLFENQPWEKMLCMAANRNNIKTFGYQHSSICRFYISQFIGKGEETFVPLPYKIITAGNFFAELYKEGGMPEDKVVIGGAWRYEHMLSDKKDDIWTKKEAGSKRIILVSLPISGFILKSMLESLVDVFSKMNFIDNLEVWLKPHPVTEPADLTTISKLSSNKYHVVNKSFPELLREADVVIASTSTSGLESFLYGKKVISYIPENFIAPDPLLDIADERIYKWYEGEDFGIDFLRNTSSSSNGSDLRAIRDRYFSKVNHKIWLNLVTAQESGI